VAVGQRRRHAAQAEPIASNVCEYGVPIGIPIAACTTANATNTATDIVAHTSSARRTLERMESNLSLAVIRSEPEVMVANSALRKRDSSTTGTQILRN
jgi:hypothetical protein